ncbi:MULTISPECIES: sulfate/molybdate ABC transporter ATP-binding protein [Rhodanobacter]|uniref:sulfate/molybdate ABC transporter ATP-binding protein n=1 Tax=Rhodanobacter TaxID=75309 RepID=UPI0003F56EB9|nr:MULTISPECIES: sulfate ABC transporter ATP-binding protein [Rhodanobacter]TAN17148.1 MAG: sulfate ABC transporter ATP-binding protein [Rhodanobacter sp.]UJJ53724.1 sulfate ABC transporter ATP-binding protein [Rhodanobacter thiooxydans]
MSLVIDNLSRRFADFAALDDVSLHLAPGEFLALLGPSGSGKTTLLRILAGLDYPDEGNVRQGNRDFLAAGARDRNVGLVFQHYALFRHLTVRENVAFGLRVRPRRTRPSKAQIRERVERLLKRVQLEDFGDRYPTQLSGGQRQRVALARALAVEPELLLLDEPFGALDAQVRVALRRWLRELHEELGLTTVFVTHDQEEALELADRIAVMNRGRIEQVGTPQAIYQDPATPFVCEFIGRTNRIPLNRVREGWAAGDWPLAMDPWGGRYQHAVAYVRPEHLVLVVPEGQPSWSARLRHVYPAGSVTHLDLQVAEIDLGLEVDVASEDIARWGWQSGAILRVAPQQLVAFSIESDAGTTVVRDRWTWRPPDLC